ncbi:hypothetical protein PG985_005903 [Apiospora marii]|uniref:F-box domain-containing protein n=1 Tax=Apiospora marii TaxID=335849 RepID=A0ABR1SDI4_9PEZI
MKRKCGKVRRKDRKKLPPVISSRKPVPLDPTKPCLAQLPDNLILLILEPLPVEDLLQVAPVSSHLYDHARDVQYYEVHIDLGRRQHALPRLDLVLRLCRVPIIRSLVITGQITGEASEAEMDEEVFPILSRIGFDMLRHAFDLRDFHWRVQNGTTTEPIPYFILESLPARTRLHLTFHHDCNDETQALAQEFLARLQGNLNLKSLVAGGRRGNGGDKSEIMRGLQGLLTSCPNLTSFSGSDHGDNLHHRGPRLSSVGLGLIAGQRPAAPLEELGLETYEWGSYPDNLNWSRLTVLRGVDDNTAQYLVPKLTNLQRLEVGEAYRHVCERDVLEQVCSPLEALSLTSYTEVTHRDDPTGPYYDPCFRPSGILRFGATLRELTLLEPISDAGLRELSRGLPRLETLALDPYMPYSALGPSYDGEEFLEAVAGFPRLRSLELWTASSCYIPDRPIAVDLARAVFARLRARSDSVRRLVLHSGAKPKYPTNWETFTNFIHLECRLVYEGCAGGSASGEGGEEEEEEDMHGYYVSVSSPDLGSAQNLELDRLARLPPKDRPIRLVAELGEQEMLIKAALEGPQVRDEWDACQREKARRASKDKVAEQRNRFSHLASNLRESRNKMWKGLLSQIGHVERDPPGC